ncbi:DUF4283 domain protein [Medicago truncatula]|uniref:DUF4283 domain protein n=1 Tax=Medicago truncatula TaxID=3880 RepID=A0A072VRK4_MEDTR|nr:DUF4283 domain protein [Medicago truncatula]
MFDWQAELGTPAPVLVSSTVRPIFTLALDMVALTTPTQATAPKPSFAQALRGSTIIYSEPLPLPVIRGDMLSVKISKEAYVCGLEACRTNLRGRLMLNKGDTSYSSKAVFEKLQTIWKRPGPWSLRSLGRGFYEFTFASYEDVCKFWAAGTVSLKLGVLRLFEWSKDFNMHTQRQTHAQSIGHNVSSCCWLHPRKEDKQAERVDNGEKPVISQKQRNEWKPKDNPDGVGSSVAFEAHNPKKIQQKELRVGCPVMLMRNIDH